MRQHLAHAIRRLRQSPGFALVAIGTLALGIGGTVALFSVVHALLIRALPYENGERLVVVWETGPRDIWARMGVSIRDYEDWRARRISFEEMAAYMPASFNVEGAAGAIRLEGQVVSSTYLPLLGIQPVLGRGFTAEEDREGAPPLVLISHGLWTSRFGGDSGVVGQAIRLNGGPFTVVGVMPPGFRVPTRDGRADLWVPLGLLGENLRLWRPTHPLTVLARLRPQVTVATASRESSAIARDVWSQEPLWAGWRLTVVSLRDEVFGDLRSPLLVLWGVTGLVLLVTCANLANLLVARGIARRRELAVRAALGAGRLQLLAGLLVESTLIAAAGGALGVALAFGGVSAATSALAPILPQLVAVTVDWWVLVYACAITAVTGVVFGLVPALWSARVDPHEVLQEGGRAAGGRDRARVRDQLVGAQVAVSMALLVAAALLGRSLQSLRAIDPGIRAEGVLTFRVTLPPATYQTPGDRAAAAERVRDGLAALPGVLDAGYGSSVPFSEPGTNRGTSVFVEGRPTGDATQIPSADVRVISDGYLPALGVRVLEGRDLRAGDDASGPRVALVSATMARRVWPGEDPLGAQIRTGDDHENLYTVVGVVDDMRNRGLREAPVQEVYAPFRQRPGTAFTVVVRTSADPASMVTAARSVVASVDPALPIYDVATMGDHLGRALAIPALAARLAGGLAALAGLLAVLGLYGIVVYAVSQRRREFAVRMALGAQGKDVIALVVGRASWIVLSGVAAGIVLSLAGTRVLGGLLHGVGAVDARIYAVVAVGLAAVALTATWVPARRASRVQPSAALRNE